MTTSTDQETDLRFSIVVPVYNEDETVRQFCASARETLSDKHEVLICYDFDEDTTLTALEEISPDQKPVELRLIRNGLGRGVRYAIEAGMKAVRSHIVVVMMCDASDDFSNVEEMVCRIERGAGVVCASRYMRGGQQIGGPVLKKLLSRTAGVTLYYLAGLPSHDATNSFKAYRRDLLENTTIESSAGFSLGLELTVKAHFGGWQVEEVPTIWHDRSEGESRFQLMRWLPQYLRWYCWAFSKRALEVATLGWSRQRLIRANQSSANRTIQPEGLP